MDMDTKELSNEVSVALDILGFRQEMIKWRRYSYLRHSDAISNCVPPAPTSLCGLNFKPVLTGSKKEGTSIWHQSDEDFMLIMDSFFCSPAPDAGNHSKSNKVWLKLKPDKRSPGYVRLHRSSTTKGNSNIALQKFLDSFTKQLPDGSQCVSSGDFNKMFYDAYNAAYASSLEANDVLPKSLVDYISKRTAQVPADPNKYTLKINSERMTLDFVTAFPCSYPELMSQLTGRKRHHGWPNKHTINRILLLPGHVVSRGSKNEESSDIEFRISYTYAEIELVKSLNNSQIKLYVLLKKLCKSELEPEFPGIFTSYVIKNTVFWVCENNPQESFTNDLLLERLLGTLSFLAECVQKETLPCYLIPDRNLFDGKISTKNKQAISELLLNMLSNGPGVVLKIEEIRKEVLRIRKDLIMELITGHFRNLAEILYLNIRERHLDYNILAAIRQMSNELYKYLNRTYFVKPA